MNKNVLPTETVAKIIYLAGHIWYQIINSVFLNPLKITKGGFFSGSAIRFFRSPNLQKNIPKNYPELEI